MSRQASKEAQADRVKQWPAHFTRPPERRIGRPGEHMYRVQDDAFREQTLRQGIAPRRNAGMLPDDPGQAVFMTTDDRIHHARPEWAHPGTETWRNTFSDNGSDYWKIDVSGLPLIEDRTYTDPESGRKRAWMSTEHIGPERLQLHEPGSEHGVSYDVPGGAKVEWVPPRAAASSRPSPFQLWAASKPHQAAIQVAQRRLRHERPELGASAGSIPQATGLLRWMLTTCGYPASRAGRAFVIQHENPGRGVSQVVTMDGQMGVALHPQRWDIGTLARSSP